MDRPNKEGARPRQVVLSPVTERQLAKFLESAGGKNVFVRRLVESLRQAWVRIAELQGEPEKRDEQEARDFASFERVLVVSEADGAVEIFTRPWVAVKWVEVRPWESREQAMETLSAEWKRLDTEPNSRCLIVPQIRPQLTEQALVDLVLWEKRCSFLDQLAGLRKT